MMRFVIRAHLVFTAPFAILAIMTSESIHPHYRMGWWRRIALGLRMFRNTLRIRTGTSYKTHLVMALKLLETPPDVAGDVVECGTWKGGSAANLSLVCRIVGRRLQVFDSFQGLPEGRAGDREAAGYAKGDYCGTLDEVKRNIGRHGAIDVCDFIPGWFEDTLPPVRSPVVLAFLDVDLEASLDTCVRHLWPRLVEGGHLFTDEAVGLDYCALFFSEKWWQRHFGQTPPGLMGAGTGLPLGEYYPGPLGQLKHHGLWNPTGVGYTQKGMSGVWTYFPD
jgi:macrocin-O-methyltransferase TylF-like protien